MDDGQRGVFVAGRGVVLMVMVPCVGCIGSSYGAALAPVPAARTPFVR